MASIKFSKKYRDPIDNIVFLDIYHNNLPVEQ